MGEEFQYEDETNESDQKLLIEEVNDPSKELDKNVFPSHVTEEIAYEASIDEGEIVSEEDEGLATEDKVEKSKKVLSIFNCFLFSNFLFALSIFKKCLIFK